MGMWVMLLLAMVLSLATSVSGQIGDVVISIDNITNTVLGSGGTELKAGNTHVIDIRYDCSGTVTGMLWSTSNSWELYSPDGADWVYLRAEKGPLLSRFGTMGIFLKHHTWNGSSWVVTGGTPSGHDPCPGYDPITSPKVGFYFALFGDGYFGFEGGVDNGIALNVFFETRLADNDLTLCFDTSIILSWEWSYGSDVPDHIYWDNGLGMNGPRCWEIKVPQRQIPAWCAEGGGVPASASEMDLDGVCTFNHCDVGTFQLCAGDFFEIDPDNVTPVSFFFAPGYETGYGNLNASTGEWTWSGASVPQSGSVDIQFGVEDPYGVQPQYFTLHVTVENQPPTTTCPVGGVVVAEGTTKSQSVSFSDPDDCDSPSIQVLGWTDYSPNDVVSVSGNVVSFKPGTDRSSASSVLMAVEVTDGELTDVCDLVWNVVGGLPYQVEITKDSLTYQGNYAQIDLVLHYAGPNDGIGGFDFLIAYDASALSFQSAEPGDIYDSCLWEYFTYRFGPDGVCGSACPSGMLTVTGMAESDNGGHHPICNVGHAGFVNSSMFPISLASLKFMVTNDRTLECQYLPVRFYWTQCTDNIISSSDGFKSFLAEKVFEFYSYDEPFAGGEITGTFAFPTYGGTMATLEAEDCLYEDTANDKYAIPGISYQNGGFDIVCADSIDARGDINLNGLPYEIADAVMFTNYFVNGPLVAFGSHYEGSLAASDCNADGLVLTVPDLVYLIRVIIGDAEAIPKTSPLACRLAVAGETYSIDTEAGAAYLVFEGAVTPQLLADNMKMRYAVVDGNVTNVLVYQDEKADQTFAGDFVRADGRLLKSEFSTYSGRPMEARLIPTSFNLGQNYPNPFNPTTEISFSIPDRGAWKLEIFNVAGQLVKSFSGVSETGLETVTWDASDRASGVYLYRVTSGGYSATKKAILMK